MDNLPAPRPRFIETFGKTLQIATKKRGWRAIIPYRFAGAIAVGAIAAMAIPSIFWANDKWDISTAVYGAILAFNGLLLAIGWGAFSKIYEIIGEGEYAEFLRRHNILDIHIFFVEVVHLALAAAAIASALALIFLMFDLPLWIDRVVFSFLVGLSINSLAEAFRANGMMHDLIWEKAQALKPEGNVHPMNRRAG